MLKIGWLLFVVGMLFGMGSMVFMITSESSNPLIEGLICQENESLVRTSRPAYDGGQSINFYCQKDDGGERINVDGKFFLLVAIGFIPLMVSIPLIIIGSFRTAGRVQKTVMDTVLNPGVGFGDGTTSQVFVNNQRVPVSNMKDINAVLGAVMQRAGNLNDTQKLTLKQKLEQLQEAYDAGLITYDELQTRKDRVLDDIAED